MNFINLYTTNPQMIGATNIISALTHSWSVISHKNLDNVK